MTKGRLRAGPYMPLRYFPQLQPGPHLQSPQSQFEQFMVSLSFHTCRRTPSAFITLRA
jgi:hypothetical protein